MFLNYEEKEPKKKDTGLKYPISFHDVQQLYSLPEIVENVDYKSPIKKKTSSTVVELGKKTTKKSGSKLF
jgi:hypothetical protein